MKQIFVTSVLIFGLLGGTHPARTQTIERIAWGQFAIMPHAEIRDFGTGNLGFDSPTNSYNPHYIQPGNARFRVTLGSASSVGGGVTTSMPGESGSQPVTVDRNAGHTMPSFALMYWTGRSMIQANYSTEYFAGYHQAMGTASYRFSTSNGEYEITTRDRETQVAIHKLQLAVSVQPTEDISLAIGVIGRIFEYRWDIGTIPPMEQSVPFAFSHLQYFVGVTGSPTPGLRAYASYTTSSPRNTASDAIFALPEGTIQYSGFTKVSYYGRIAYGLQGNPWSPLTVSIEMRHQYLATDQNDLDNTVPAYYYGDPSVLNTDITGGVAVSLSSYISLGALYSKYLKFETKEGLAFANYNGEIQYASMTNPYTIVITGRGTYEAWELNAAYQYSTFDINYPAGSSTSPGPVTTTGRYLSMGLSYTVR